ncbi:alpha/beta fold hydrolase [Micromonospora rosaria]|nr:hypothetical protein [Micromonospora rosaria]
MGQKIFAELLPHLVSAFTVITYDQRDRGETAFAPVPYTTTIWPMTSPR